MQVVSLFSLLFLNIPPPCHDAKAEPNPTLRLPRPDWLSFFFFFFFSVSLIKAASTPDAVFIVFLSSVVGLVVDLSEHLDLVC